jgi:ribosomal protein S18 acetylase RimI-like enzyme
MSAARIVPLGQAELEAFVEHLQRHGAESGRDGDILFRPRSPNSLVDPIAIRARIRGSWELDLTQPTWLRSWGVLRDQRIVGHLDLRGGSLAAELHRATVGMGVERPERRHGHGRSLLELAIAWARSHDFVWLDLDVFVHNHPARSLYRAVGFQEIGLRRDGFRVDGHSIDDLQMTLAL